jgi:chromosome segregation ATPase
LDTALLTDGAVAVAGLAAGVLSQVPQMRALEAQAAAAEADRDAQVKVLKDQLFALDREYEEGTADLKTQFDDLREVELSRQQKRQAEEFQFRWQAQLDEVRQEYDVQLARQKADLLSRQLEDVGTMTGDRQAELVTLRLEQTQLTERNNKLKALLDEARGQIEELQSKNGSSFFDFLRRS